MGGDLVDCDAGDTRNRALPHKYPSYFSMRVVTGTNVLSPPRDPPLPHPNKITF